jgi:C-methyltransferase
MTQQPHEVIWTLTNAVVVSSSVHVVAELGVADHIGDDPVSVSELALRCGADPDALDRVLRLLAAHGVFSDVGGAYEHTEPSRLLCTDHPRSMRAFARMMALPVMSATVGQLQTSVRTGSPALEQVAPEGLWPYLQSHPAEAEIFGQAMTAKAGADIAAVLGAYDFSRFGTIADIGGGRGHLLRAVLDAVPTAEGVLFDLPEVITTLDLDRDRLTARAGDFFVDPLPSADSYICMEVIHDWSDGEAAAILRAIRRAAEPTATVLIIEGVIAEERPDPRVQTLDVVMLAFTGGRERSPDQLEKLLDSADLQLSRIIETTGPMSIIEAINT